MSKNKDTLNRPPTPCPIRKEKNPMEDLLKVNSKIGADSLDILERIVKCLQNDDEGTIKVFKIFLEVVESCDEKKEVLKKLVSTILTYTETSTLVEIRNISTELQDAIATLYLMIDQSRLEQIDLLGEGGYGTVCLCLFTKGNTKIKVAVKEPSTRDQKILILKNEIKIMSQLHHPNVIKILGIVKQPCAIVMEYMELGTLRETLTNNNFSNIQLLKFIVEIASGMEYIASKKIIHRDLAIRNIFVNQNHRCKVGDFGFSCFADATGNYIDPFEDIITIGTAHEAPEVILNQQYTTKSDVYSMGLLIWEIYMIASGQQDAYMRQSLLFGFSLEHPYRTILNRFHRNGELFRPHRITTEVHMLIKNDLLNIDPERRTTFSKLKEIISEMLK